MANAKADVSAESSTVDHDSLDEAHAAALGELPAIGRDRVMKDTSGKEYNYRSIHDIMPYISRVMARHQITVTPRVLERHVGVFVTNSNKEWKTIDLLVEFKVTHPSGVGEHIGSAWGEGADAMDKATNKAMTGALKNFLISYFAINDGEDPDDTASQDGRRSHAAPTPTLSEEEQDAIVDRLSHLPAETRLEVLAKIGRQALRALPDTWAGPIQGIITKAEVAVTADEAPLPMPNTKAAQG